MQWYKHCSLQILFFSVCSAVRNSCRKGRGCIIRMNSWIFSTKLFSKNRSQSWPLKKAYHADIGDSAGGIHKIPLQLTLPIWQVFDKRKHAPQHLSKDNSLSRPQYIGKSFRAAAKAYWLYKIPYIRPHSPKTEQHAGSNNTGEFDSALLIN